MPDNEIYTNLPEWNEPGTEPTQQKKDTGWQPGERPPAGWFNWLFHRIYQSLLELAQAITSHSEQAAPHVGHERTENKGQPGGYAGLDDDGHIPASQLGNVIGMEEHGNEWHSEDFQTSAEAQAHVNDKSNPHGVTAAQVGAPTTSQFNNHTGDQSAHGATSSATANRIVIRDSAGRAQFADPSAAQDAATKAWVEGNCYLQSQWGKSVATFGYIRFPNGIILQWGMSLSGSSDSVSVTFPIAFPNICLGVVTSKVSGSTYEAITTDHSKTGMTVVNNPGGTDVGRARYFAIGY